MNLVDYGKAHQSDATYTTYRSDIFNNTVYLKWVIIYLVVAYQACLRESEMSLQVVLWC